MQMKLGSLRVYQRGESPWVGLTKLEESSLNRVRELFSPALKQLP